jgi:hypothetical protein
MAKNWFLWYKNIFFVDLLNEKDILFCDFYILKLIHKNEKNSILDT